MPWLPHHHPHTSCSTRMELLRGGTVYFVYFVPWYLVFLCIYAAVRATKPSACAAGCKEGWAPRRRRAAL